MFYDVVAALDRNRAAAAAQAEQAVQLTTQTIVQKTKGLGYGHATLAFDVVFTAEPTIAAGASLVSIDYRNWIPVASAHVVAWQRNARGEYTGAQIYLYVDAHFQEGFVTTGRVTSEASPTPVMAHHLVFSGLAHLPVSGETAALAQTVVPYG